MIIAITTIAAIAAIVFGVTQKNKLKHTEELLSDKVTANTILRSHMNNVESELKAANDHIKSLRSELQSCTDKAKAAKAKAQATKAPVAKAEKPAATKVEKAPPAMKAAVKAKRPYKKKAE